MNKKILIAVILTFVANILCIPLWTECDYIGFVRSLFNKEARLDMFYHGEITDAEPFHFDVPPNSLSNNTFSSYRKGNSRRAILNLRARGKWQRLSFQLVTHHEGEIRMLLRGPDPRDEYGLPHSILTDWRNFKINGETIFNEPKTLSFQKNFSKKISVRKNETLHIEVEFRRHHFTINDFTFLKRGTLWYLLTGNVLFFFSVCRLFSFFNERCGYIRLGDALLVAAFFSLVFIPMMGISDGVKSVRENRMLAVQPEAKGILEGKADTGGGYEKWFNDHLGGRTVLIKLHDVIRNKLSHIIRTEEAIYFKENGWAFLLPFVSNLDCRPAPLQHIVCELLKMNCFCQQHKIKFYVFEVPKKQIIYKELLREKYGFDEKQFIRVERAQETIRKEVRKHHVPYVYPYEELRDATKQDFVFFNYSHHWTDWGAFIGYRKLMEEVRKDFPDISVASLDDYRRSQNRLQRDDYLRNYRPPEYFSRLFNDEHLSDPSSLILYNYYDHKNGDRMIVRVGEFIKDFTYPEGTHKIMLMGTSQNENLLQFVPYSSTRTKYIRLNLAQVKNSDMWKVLKLYKKDILSFKPDILILSISTDNLPELHDLCTSK